VAAVLYRVSIQTASGEKVSLLEKIYMHVFGPLASPANASLLYALAFVAACWAVMAVLYRKGIVIKI